MKSTGRQLLRRVSIWLCAVVLSSGSLFVAPAIFDTSFASAIPLKGQKSKKGKDLPPGIVGGPTNKVRVEELSDPLNAESDYEDKKRPRPSYRFGSPESYYTTPPPKPPVTIRRQKRPLTWSEGGHY